MSLYSRIRWWPRILSPLICIKKGRKEVISPFTGDFIADKAPVFTRAVEQEFTNILQRKYEVLDAKIPGNIADAAKEITAMERRMKRRRNCCTNGWAAESSMIGIKWSCMKNSGFGRNRHQRIRSTREKVFVSIIPGYMHKWPDLSVWMWKLSRGLGMMGRADMGLTLGMKCISRRPIAGYLWILLG